MNTATAQSHPNIAFIKYWGVIDPRLHIPSNSSLSMNLDGLHTRTCVTFDTDQEADTLRLNGAVQGGEALRRVSEFLDRVRTLAGFHLFAAVESENNFPTGTGIASSASAFAALSLAASAAAGLDMEEADLSRLARTGSGSACRSVPDGYVEWQAGTDHHSSYAYSIAPASHWDLVDCVAIISEVHKPTGSREGHQMAGTSPLQTARVADTPRRMEICRRAVLGRDLEALAEVVESDCLMMHAVMMTSSPALIYWMPATLEIMNLVVEKRRSGVPVFYTIDAGPNVHVICPGDWANRVTEWLEALPGVKQVLRACAGESARLESTHS
jgi:diphosphomevalonate decarboxylase